MQCEKCGGPMWDNSNDKRNPRSPDYKCKDRNCGHGMWSTPRNGGGNSGGNSPAPTNGTTTPHAVLYKLCVQYAKKEILPLLSKDATDDNLLAAAATLFIQASKGGATWPMKAAPEPPPPPPPPVQHNYDDPDSLPF